MRRYLCGMCHYLGEEKYCDYYDVFYMKCDEMTECPDGLDDEEEYDEEYYSDEEYYCE